MSPIVTVQSKAYNTMATFPIYIQSKWLKCFIYMNNHILVGVWDMFMGGGGGHTHFLPESPSALKVLLSWGGRGREGGGGGRLVLFSLARAPGIQYSSIPESG